MAIWRIERTKDVRKNEARTLPLTILEVVDDETVIASSVTGKRRRLTISELRADGGNEEIDAALEAARHKAGITGSINSNLDSSWFSSQGYVSLGNGGYLRRTFDPR
jgi:hypothetical protein